MPSKCLIIFVLAIALSSCESFVTMDRIITIRKGMTPKDVEKMVNTESVMDVKVKQHGREYSIIAYPMTIGTGSASASKWQGSLASGAPRNTYMVDLTSTYYFLYDDSDRLMFWGFLEEFSKNEDQSISDFSVSLQKEYYKFKYNMTWPEPKE